MVLFTNKQNKTNKNIIMKKIVLRLHHTNSNTNRTTICDPTQVNEADVIRGLNCDFAVSVFCRNQGSF